MKRKLGRNDQCWCGSGIKYKRCHLDRENQSRPVRQEILQRFYSVWEKGHCLHPKAGRQTCSSRIISAHTIRRNGDLGVIAKNGHVYSLMKHGPLFGRSARDTSHAVNKVGIKEASTFRGFCSKHDNELFAPIERNPFRATPEQIALLGYRTLCYELLMKEGFLRLEKLYRDMDKGKPLPYQEYLQRTVSHYDLGAKKGNKRNEFAEDEIRRHDLE